MTAGAGDDVGLIRERMTDIEPIPDAQERWDYLQKVWAKPRGFRVLSETNNNHIGVLFVLTGLFFFVAAGIMALLIRIQLAWPNNQFIDPETFNQLFTMHGTVMMFLFAVPILEGIAAYLLPQMLGARDLPFPRLSAYGYWCYLFGGLIVLSSVFTGNAPDSGWFLYPPLASDYSEGVGNDYWLLGVAFIEISAIAAAIEIVVAVVKIRAPYMALDEMPLFAWYWLVVALMIVFGFPPLIVGSLLMEIERAFGFPFFDPTRGGSPLLWQHLFWLFGHPEVYIIFLPAVGMIAMILPTFVQRPFVGYHWAVVSAVAVGFISFGLWVHHMYVTGLPHLSLSFFSGASLSVVIPNAIQFFLFIATVWLGRPVFRTPFLFLLAFFFTFLIGGLTGVMVALVPFDSQAHDTYFIVAHLHYVLIGGMVFPLFAGLYYWMPMVTGRLMSETVGRWVVTLLFGGFNIAFFPMHLTGLLGMPRRVYTYGEEQGWTLLNQISTLGTLVIVAGVLLFLIDLIRHRYNGPIAGHNPWNAGTLEWILPTPVRPSGPLSIPMIDTRYPLWQQEGVLEQAHGGRGYLPGSITGGRETMQTSAVDGQPEQVIALPSPTWVPLIAAIFTAVFFIGFIVKSPWMAGAGAAAALAMILYWGWQLERPVPQDPVRAHENDVLPVHTGGTKTHGWWGLAILLLVDGAAYASLIFSYLFLWTVRAGDAGQNWPPLPHSLESLELNAVAAALLVLSLIPIRLAVPAAAAGRNFWVGLLLALGVPLLIVSSGVQLWALLTDPAAPTADSYVALLWALVGYQAFHAAIGALMGLLVLIRTIAGLTTIHRHTAVELTALFWRYTVAIGLIGMALCALFPRLTEGF